MVRETGPCKNDIRHIFCCIICINSDCVKKEVGQNWVCHSPAGNPKTLTSGLRTPTTDQARRLPIDQSMVYPYGPTLWTTTQNRIKIINISVTGCLIDYLCRRNFERYNVQMQEAWVQARAQFVSLHIAISFAVATQYIKNHEASRKLPGNLEIKFALFPLCHFVQPILPQWVRELIPAFTIYTAELQIQTSLINNLKQIRSQTEPQVEGKNFLLFAISIFLHGKQLLDIFRGCYKPRSVTFA